MTAFIGNAGNTGELKITPEAQVESDRYGVDVYKFNKDNLRCLDAACRTHTYRGASATQDEARQEGVLVVRKREV